MKARTLHRSLVIARTEITRSANPSLEQDMKLFQCDLQRLTSYSRIDQERLALTFHSQDNFGHELVASRVFIAARGSIVLD